MVAAVETTAERRPRTLKLLPTGQPALAGSWRTGSTALPSMVKGFRKRQVEKLARAHLEPGSTVVSDGLACWAAVGKAGCDHCPMVAGSGRQAARWAPFTLRRR